MNHRSTFLLSILTLATILPLGEAAVQQNQIVDCPLGETISVQNGGIPLLFSAGQTVICVTLPYHVARIGDTATVSLTAVGPVEIAAPNAAGGVIIGSTSGCTGSGQAAAALAVNPVTAAGTAYQELQTPGIGNDIIINQGALFTTTSAATSCRANVRFYACLAIAVITNCNGVPFLYNIVVAVNFNTMDTESQVFNINCDDTSSAYNLLDRTQVCNSPTIATTLSGTINTVVSGSLNVAVTSMPVLTVTDTSTVTIASIPTLNANIGITSIPSLNIASIPTLTVNDQVHILDAVAFHQILDGQAHLVLDNGTLYVNGVQISQSIGNQSVVFPGSINTTVKSSVWDEVGRNALPILFLFFFQIMGETIGRKRKDYSYTIIAATLSLVYGIGLDVGTPMRIVFLCNCLYQVFVCIMRARYNKQNI